MKLHVLRAACIGTLAVTTVAANAQIIYIDTFTEGPFELVANAANPVRKAVQSGLTTVEGGQRDVLLEWQGGFQEVIARLDTGATFQFYNAQSLTNGRLTLQYDGMDDESGSMTSLNSGDMLNADWRLGTHFVLRFAEVDGGIGPGILLRTTVASGTGTDFVDQFITSGVNKTVNVHFSSFTGIDWSDVRRVEFRFDGGSATDFALDSIGVHIIPGPAAALPFLTAFVAMRRRKKK
jgi:hypothetical protein